MSMRNEPVHPPSMDLFAYRDGELLPEKRATVEAHVMGCSLCRTLIDQVSSLEAELRQSPDRSPPHYLEQLHESVRARLEADRAMAPAGAGHAARPGPAREEAAVGAAGTRRGRTRRGGLEGDGGDERLRDAPRLPWAAILSTASAAAMVVVVAVFLVKQGIYQRTSTPRMPSRVSQAPVGQPGEEPGARVALGTSDTVAGGAAGRQKSAARAKQEAAARGAAKLDAAAKDRLLKRGDLAARKAAERAPSAGEGAPENQARESEEPPAAAAPRESVAPRALAQEGQSALGRVRAASGREYNELLSQFGLPPVWNSSVSPEALGSAEPALRDLYVTGRVGSDSARVRLYLAEAARLRYAPGDSTLYEEIEHHYRRAIALAGPDAETARVAEERLRSLER